MQNKDWIKAGEDILHSVLNAVEQQDFSGLSKQIENKVNNTLGYVGEKINETYRSNATQEWMKAKREKEQAEQKQRAEKITQPKMPALYQKNPPGTYSGTVFQILGIIGTALFGVSAAVLTMLGWLTGIFALWLVDGVVGILMVGSVVMLSCGVKIKGRINRFRSYVRKLGDKQYCKIEELAQTVGKSKRFVEKELRRMIRDNYFLEGHLDQIGTTLITSHEVYNQYLEAEESRKNRELEAAKQAALQDETQAYPEKVQMILEEGNRYIQHIHASNDAIPGEVMSQKLETLEHIMKRIFAQLKKHPESCDDLQKLMKYYLPTTQKLLDAYIELDGQAVYSSGNIETTKKEIEDTLDVINSAFCKLFDDMFEETAWDISADISTMKTMLAKEGLTGERDFQL